MFLWFQKEKVACAAPISLCYVKAMTSYLMFVVRQVKGECGKEPVVHCSGCD